MKAKNLVVMTVMSTFIFGCASESSEEEDKNNSGKGGNVSSVFDNINIGKIGNTGRGGGKGGGAGQGSSGNIGANIGSGGIGASQGNSTPYSGQGNSNKLFGRWVTGCLPQQDGKSSLKAEINFLTDSGQDYYTQEVNGYPVSDCSGDSDYYFAVAGPVTFNGKQSTATCTAEKFDSTFTVAQYNDYQYTGTNLEDFLYLHELPDSTSSIACVYKGKLIFGADTSDGYRPTTMDTSLTFTRIQ